MAGLVMHRAGEPRVEIPRDVEDAGAEAIEAYVAAYIAAHPEEAQAARAELPAPEAVPAPAPAEESTPKRSRRS